MVLSTPLNLSTGRFSQPLDCVSLKRAASQSESDLKVSLLTPNGQLNDNWLFLIEAPGVSVTVSDLALDTIIPVLEDLPDRRPDHAQLSIFTDDEDDSLVYGIRCHDQKVDLMVENQLVTLSEHHAFGLPKLITEFRDNLLARDWEFLPLDSVFKALGFFQTLVPSPTTLTQDQNRLAHFLLARVSDATIRSWVVDGMFAQRSISLLDMALDVQNLMKVINNSYFSVRFQTP